MFIYAVKDVLASSIVMLFHEANDSLAKRRIEQFILAPGPNQVNMFVNDKQVYLVAEIEKESLLVKPLPSPKFICEVREVRDNVLRELCNNEEFVKVQVEAIKKQKEVILNGQITRKDTKKRAKKVEA